MCVQLLFFGGMLCAVIKQVYVCVCVFIYIYIYMRQMCVCNDCVSVSASNQMQFLDKKEEGVFGVLLLSSAYFIL